MREPVSLMEFLQELQADAGMRGDFLADPHATLAEHGLAHLSPADVHDALVLVEDTRVADFDPGFGTGAGPLPFGAPPAPGEGAPADTVGYLSTYLTDGPAGDTADFGAGRPEPYGSAYEDLFDLGPDGDPDADLDAGFGSGAAGPQHHDADF